MNYDKLIVVFGLLILALSSVAQAQDVSLVGVKVGDSFQFKVTENDFTSSTSQTYLTQLINYYDFDGISVNNQYNFTSILNTINATMNPTAGTKVNVTVTQLPTADTLSGKVNFAYNSVNKEVLTGFLIGTPITFTDWGFWKNLLESYYNYNGGNFTLQTGVFNNSNTFNATVRINFNNVPSNIRSYYNSLSVLVAAGYNTHTGVLNEETITFMFTGAYSTNQTFSISKSLSSTVNTNNITGPVPGFEAIAFLSSMAILVIFYRKKKE